MNFDPGVLTAIVSGAVTVLISLIGIKAASSKIQADTQAAIQLKEAEERSHFRKELMTEVDRLRADCDRLRSECDRLRNECSRLNGLVFQLERDVTTAENARTLAESARVVAEAARVAAERERDALLHQLAARTTSTL